MNKNLLKFVKLFIPTKVYRKYKRRHLLRSVKPLTIIEHPNDVFETVYRIKDDTWETYRMAEVYNIAKSTIVKKHHQAQDILRVDNARIMANSDIVISPKGILWDKYYSYNFDSSIKPWDEDLLSWKENQIQVHRSATEQYIEGGCVSLLGVFVNVWAHFMMQFVCKMYYAEEAGLFNKNNTTLLVPYNMDENMKELVDNLLKRHLHLMCVVAQRGVEYKCEKLYYMQSACDYHNQSVIYSHTHIVIPQKAVDTIQNYIAKPYLDKIEKKNPKYEKVFLIRRNTTRSLVNNDEVEDFFKKEGFFFMEGADYSLQEKAEIFHSAKIIVGPQGTAFTNTIFCDEAKCMVFVNTSHIMENSLYNLSYPHVKRCIHVTGDDTSTHYDCTVYLPLEKIKRAYKELLEDEQ